MNPDVRPINLSSLDNGLMSPIVQKAWHWYQNSNGVLDDHLAYDEVCITHSTMAVDELPAFVSIGQNGTLTQIMGEAWAEEAIGHPAPSNPIMDQIARPGYETAAVGHPTLDLLSLEASLPVGLIELHYDRLILPVWTPTQHPLLLVATGIIAPH